MLKNHLVRLPQQHSTSHRLVVFDRLPGFLEPEEMIRVLNHIDNVKHKLIIQLLYGAGLRVSEVTHLKVRDVELTPGYGWVRQGKGGKDRLFIIPKSLNGDLSAYIVQEHR